MSIASGVFPARWARGLSASDERQSAAEFFEAFPWEGPAVEGAALTSEEFFDAFCEPEPPSPPTLRGYRADGSRGEP